MNATTLSFDILFPMTWYEKALHTLTSIWHTMQESDIDVIMGKCAFTCFCVKKMRQTKQHIIPDDIMYFSEMLQSLEQRIIFLFSSESEEDKDKCMCVQDIINRMHQQLHIPSDIDTK